MKKGTTSAPGVRPLGDKVLIQEIEGKDETRKTDSGLYIPATVKEDRETKKGKVIAVGEGRFEDGKRIPVEVKQGQTVIFSWGDKIKVDGVEYYIVRESEISAVIK